MTMNRVNLTNYELFYDILNSASPTFKELKICFKPETLSFYSYDEAMSSLIHCELKKSFFDEYTCDEEKEVCVFLLQLLQILKSSKTTGSANIELIEDIYFHIKLSLDYEKKYKLLTIHDSYTEGLKIPNINNDLTMSINSNSFLDLIKDVQYISEYIQLESQDNNIFITGEGIYGDVNINLNKDTSFVTDLSINNTIKNKYDVKFLNNLIKEATECFSSCIITIQNAGPMKITFNIFDMGTLLFFIAPFFY